MPRPTVRVKPGPRHPPVWFAPEFPFSPTDLLVPVPASRLWGAPHLAPPAALTEIQELGGCLGLPSA